MNKPKCSTWNISKTEKEVQALFVEEPSPASGELLFEARVRWRCRGARIHVNVLLPFYDAKQKTRHENIST
jgi:hypothetical protein